MMPRRPREIRNSLDEGLGRLNARLGLNTATHNQTSQRVMATCHVTKTTDVARSIFYAPDMDGQVDPGEIVWFIAPVDKHSGEERAMVVIARTGDTVYGLLISANAHHDKEETWLDIGAGPWNKKGHNAWVRLDKVITVPETSLRREGSVIPQQRFDRIARRLRKDYGWA
ncbi:PemK-like protein [Corynebacterium kutscheri]|nr:PemK-like protein [Corynebacterium kutscheri]